MIIYLIENLQNKKKYIGQTIRDPDSRWYEHKNLAGTKLKHPLYNAIRKYGTENFTFTVLCSTRNQEDLNLLETYFINKYNSADLAFGYNLRISGGRTGKLNNETRLRFSLAQLGVKKKPGKKLTEEHKAKIGRATKSRGVSAKLLIQLRNNSEKLRGQPLSLEHRKKLVSYFTGSVFITNGVESKRCREHDIIPNGWYRGKASLKTKRKHTKPAWNKGLKSSVRVEGALL